MIEFPLDLTACFNHQGEILSLANEVLDALLAAGATAEMIVAAVKAENGRELEIQTTRRENDAERQRRHRAKTVSVTPVTVTTCDSRGQAVTAPSPLPPLGPPPLSPAPQTPPPISPPTPHPEGGVEKLRSAPPARLTTSLRLEVWMLQQGLDDIPHDWGMWSVEQQGLTSAEVNAEWEKFLDYWKSDGRATARKRDWEATWRNWVRRSAEFKQRKG